MGNKLIRTVIGLFLYSLLFAQSHILANSDKALFARSRISYRYGPIWEQQIMQVLEDFQVNENVGSCNHYQPKIAAGDTGNFVMVWLDERDGNLGIYCQRYSSSGMPLGSNFRVNDDTAIIHESSKPAVGLSDNGSFVVIWCDLRNGDCDIYGQRYTNSGTKQGTNFKINDDAGIGAQQRPAIAVDGSGNSVVVWNDNRNKTNIYGQRYTSSGDPVGTNFKVNDTTIIDFYTEPAIGAGEMGNFIVVWSDIRSGDPSFSDIYGQRYGSSGFPEGTNFRINDDAAAIYDFSEPAISADDPGNFVVVWQDYRNGNTDIYAQCYTSSGDKQGNNFKINEGVNNCKDPAIAMDNSGDFVVVWLDNRWDNGIENTNIYGQQYTSSGNPVGTNFKVNDDTAVFDYYSEPAISAGGIGNYFMVWSDDRNGNTDIYAQHYTSSGTTQDANFKINDDTGSSGQHEPVIGVDGSGNFVVVWQDKRNGRHDDIYGQLYTSNGTKQDNNFKINDDAGSILQYNPAIAMDSRGNFAVVWCDYRNGDIDIYGQCFTDRGSKRDNNFKINDDVSDCLGSAIAMDGSGDFVVVWRDWQNVYGQRYSISGVKQGDNFRINDNEGRCGVYDPVIAADKNGNFVVVWQDNRNGQYRDIYGQRFSSDGSEQGGNFRINDNVDPEGTSSGRGFPAVTMDDNGNFVVAWVDWRRGGGIYGQRYSSNGTMQGNNFKINDDVVSRYFETTISMNDRGNFVVAWQDNRNGENDPDVYSQRYDNNGTMLGSNYRVNNDIGGNIQASPDVKLVNQHIYYTWEDTRVPGQGYDIFARVDLFSSVSVAEKQPEIIKVYVLYPNYPNPFNTETQIVFDIPKRINVTLVIYNITGQHIRTLIDAEKSQGSHILTWNSRDDSGHEVPSGVYFCRLITDDFSHTRKMLLVR